MNKVILLGNLCKDIEVRYTKNNKMVVSNTLAVKNDYKNANGDYDTQFINVIFWDTKAENISKYAKKGSQLLIEGRLNVRSYEKPDSTKEYITEVEAVKVRIFKKPDIKEEELKKVDPFEKQTNIYEEFGNDTFDFEDEPF